MRAFFIAGLLVLMASKSFALRCGNEIIDVGDSIHQVQRLCTVETEYHVQNVTADITLLYFTQNGMHYTLKFIDGVLVGVGGER